MTPHPTVERVLPMDAIPSIDDPEFGSEYVGDPGDRVVVLDGNPPRAYPTRILSYHEIVNDTLDRDEETTPVAVTWCPLCGSAVVYERDVAGRTLSFGVSGKLADDDLVMYDRETGSEWKQSLGRAIAGELAGETLDVLPATVTTWERFRQEFDGVVLQPDGTPSEAASADDSPAEIDYSVDPYEEYVAGEGFGLAAHRGSGEGRTWEREDIDPKTVVLGVEYDGDAVGYPRPRVGAAGGVVTDTVGGHPVVVIEGAEELHAFDHPGWAFQRREDGTVTADGTVWDPVTGRSADGRELSRIPARRVFAFTWQDDHGPDSFYRPDGSTG